MPLTDAAGNPVHVAFPFRRGPDGKLVTVEQDTSEHHASQVATVASYPQGYRDDKPAFGRPPLVFRNIPLDLEAFRAAVERWVTDADLTVEEYSAIANAAYGGDRIIEVEVT